MAMTTVIYANAKPYTVGTLQPLATVTLAGPLKNVLIKGVLVDTGADLLQVPEAAAIQAGWMPSLGMKITIGTAGGTISMIKLTSVAIQIEGVHFVTDMLCHPNPSSRPLLGRTALAGLINFGFDPANWLWR
jgi:predicted aspartyl protease